MNAPPNNSMDVRAKQRLSYLACPFSLSLRVIGSAPRQRRRWTAFSNREMASNPIVFFAVFPFRFFEFVYLLPTLDESSTDTNFRRFPLRVVQDNSQRKRRLRSKSVFCKSGILYLTLLTYKVSPAAAVSINAAV